MDQEPKYRISFLAGAFLVFIAFVFDFVEIILDLFGFGVAGTIKDIAQIIFFPTVFFIFKAPFWKGKKKAKKIIAMLSSMFVAIIPILSTVAPEVTIGVLLTVYYTRKEDREGVNDKEQKQNRNITRPKRVREKIRK